MNREERAAWLHKQKSKRKRLIREQSCYICGGYLDTFTAISFTFNGHRRDFDRWECFFQHVKARARLDGFRLTVSKMRS